MKSVSFSIKQILKSRTIYIKIRNIFSKMFCTRMEPTYMKQTQKHWFLKEGRRNKMFNMNNEDLFWLYQSISHLFINSSINPIFLNKKYVFMTKQSYYTVTYLQSQLLNTSLCVIIYRLICGCNWKSNTS